MNSKLYLILVIFIFYFAASASSQSPCEGKLCGDNNPCTVDACDESTGDCVNLPVPDKYSCGGGRECSNGLCVESLMEEIPDEIPAESATPTGLFGFLDYDLALTLLSVIILAGAAYYALRK